MVTIVEIEESVIKKIEDRRHRGHEKYKTTMERTDLSTVEWLRHAQEEALDLAIYLEKLIQEESKKLPSYQDVIKQVQTG